MDTLDQTPLGQLVGLCSASPRLFLIPIHALRWSPRTRISLVVRRRRKRKMARVPSILPSLASSNPLRWITVCGPGAIIASLTIGSGELVFSSRGGAIFGYSILWVFLFVSVLKWALVFASARHMVLSGAHPFERWICLPGPRAWLPIALLLPAIVTIPIWIGFLAGTTGTLFQDLTGIDKHICGAAALSLVAGFVVFGGYRVLERVQVGILGVLLLAVSISAVLMNPDWVAVLRGFLPSPLLYPDWLAESAPDIAQQPIWVEVSLYVGVVGGASYDYIAYVAFLREKHWGLSSVDTPVPGETINALANDAALTQWLRAPLVDCTLSFLAVILFSAVFVISGAVALSPSHQIPSGDNLLNLQAEFVTQLSPWLYPLYVIGASLTLLGTLYGTNEVGPAMVQELCRACNPTFASQFAKRIRSCVVGWGITGGFLVLGWSYLNHMGGAEGNPPTLVQIVTPAALFTHVTSCALICFLNPWMDRQFLPPRLRMGWVLTVLNLVAGIVFLGVGIKSYWEYGAARSPTPILGGLIAAGSLASVVVLGLIVAWLFLDRSQGASAE